jgi:hypothetical protein
MVPPADIAPSREPRLSSVSRILGWFVGCTSLGVLVVVLVGEFGSIVFLTMAFLIGLSGAIGHTVFNGTEFFGRCSFSTQVVLLACSGIVIPAFWLLATGTFAEPRDGAQVLIYFFGPMIGMSVAAAFCINWLDRKGLESGSSDRSSNT